MRSVIAVLSASACLMASSAALAQEAYTFEDVVHLTCEEAAAVIGDDADRLGVIVAPLVEFSLIKRNLTVPDDRPGIGQEFGELLKAFCTAEPDGLLYNAVDRAIRRLM